MVSGAVVVEVWAYQRWPQVVAMVESSVAMDGWLVHTSGGTWTAVLLICKIPLKL